MSTTRKMAHIKAFHGTTFGKWFVVCSLIVPLGCFFSNDSSAQQNDQQFISKLEKSFSINKELRTKIRGSVEKSLPYIQRRGDWWIKRNDCMSCHRTSFTAWSHQEAGKAGIEVQQEKVDYWTKWNHENLFEAFPKKDQKYPGEKTIERNLSGAAQMLFVTGDLKKDQYSKEEEKILGFLEKGQRKDGSWAPKGQLPGQKRSLVETAQVITHWNSLGLLALKQKRPELSDRIRKMIEKSKTFSENYKEGKSSEWMAVRLLYDVKTGREESGKGMLKRLRGSQNKDGGWGWIAGKKTDSLATSQILYVLCEVRKEHPEWIEESEIKKVVSLLISRQGKKGIWANPGTKTEMKGKIEPTASYWATCWAVISLSRVLQDSKL